jgi:hypothetical protein
MANKTLLINFTIAPGKYLKLCYRPIGSTDPFTCVPTQIYWTDSPFSLVVDDTYLYELELSTICGSCDANSGTSNPVYILEPDPVP